MKQGVVQETLLNMHWVEGSMGVWGWLMMLLMMVFWLALLAAVVAAAYWLVRRASEDGEDDAEAILRERYARGEIDEDEYHERKNNL